MIVGEFRHKKSKGFATSIFSKMYSSVAKLNRMSFDSAISTSQAVSFSLESHSGHFYVADDANVLLEKFCTKVRFVGRLATAKIKD